MTSSPDRGTAFLAAFNDIEQRLRELVDGKRSVNFPTLVSIARRHGLVNDNQAEDLRQFGTLRNAISHGAYQNYRPIAEPLPETVTEIEHLRDLILRPPLATEVLGHQEVITLAPDDHIREALKVIQKTTISQFPVYEGSRYVALLTTNTIARWVAADLDDNDHLDARLVSEVLEYAERGDHAVFLSRQATAQEAVDALTQPATGEILPRAIVVTESGRQDQRPFRVIGGSDIVKLSEALN